MNRLYSRLLPPTGHCWIDAESNSKFVNRRLRSLFKDEEYIIDPQLIPQLIMLDIMEYVGTGPQEQHYSQFTAKIDVFSLLNGNKNNLNITINDNVCDMPWKASVSIVTPSQVYTNGVVDSDDEYDQHCHYHENPTRQKSLAFELRPQTLPPYMVEIDYFVNLEFTTDDEEIERVSQLLRFNEQYFSANLRLPQILNENDTIQLSGGFYVTCYKLTDGSICNNPVLINPKCNIKQWIQLDPNADTIVNIIKNMFRVKIDMNKDEMLLESIGLPPKILAMTGLMEMELQPRNNKPNVYLKHKLNTLSNLTDVSNVFKSSYYSFLKFSESKIDLTKMSRLMIKVTNLQYFDSSLLLTKLEYFKPKQVFKPQITVEMAPERSNETQSSEIFQINGRNYVIIIEKDTSKIETDEPTIGEMLLLKGLKIKLTCLEKELPDKMTIMMNIVETNQLSTTKKCKNFKIIVNGTTSMIKEHVIAQVYVNWEEVQFVKRLTCDIAVYDC